MKWLLVLGLYLSLAIVNTGAFNANFRHDFPDLAQDGSWTRENFGIAILWGLNPGSIIMTPFFTGFYEDGLSYEYKPRTCSEPDEISKKVWCKE